MGPLHHPTAIATAASTRHRNTLAHIPKRMKTSLLAALFLFACLFFAAAIAQEDEGAAEVDPELAELNAFFKNLIPGTDTTLDEEQLSQINTALGRSGPHDDGSKIIEVNINLKLLLIKLANGGIKLGHGGLYNERD